MEICCDFMIGIHGDNQDTIKKKTNFTLEPVCDYAQFQIALPIYPAEFLTNVLSEINSTKGYILL